MTITVASGTVDFSDTTVTSCPYAATCRYPNSGSWPIPAGNHHLKLTCSSIVNSGIGNQIGMYGSPSGTAVDISADGVTVADGEGDFPITDTSVDFYYWGPAAFTGFDYVIEASPAPTDPAPVGYCQYGTEPNPDAVYYELISDSLIDLVVGAALIGTANAYLVPYVETALAALEGSIFIGVDCSTMPGAGPTLDFPNLSTLSTSTLLAWFQNAAWRFFCQCVRAPPGSPAPISPPPPPIVRPPLVVPVQPAPVCDNMDLCSYLEAMKAQLQSITAQVSYLRTDVRLIQRQHVPFAYVPGTLHSGLTGAGQFAVQGILGLAVQVTTVPGSSGEEAGDPIARFGLGWVTTGTPGGWRRAVPIRHNPMWVDAEPDDTLVGYSLEPLVVANIQEQLREP